MERYPPPEEKHGGQKRSQQKTEDAVQKRRLPEDIRRGWTTGVTLLAMGTGTHFLSCKIP